DDVVLAGVDAYNNFLFDQFCAPDRSRLIGMAQIPSVGVDVSVDYLLKAAARGFKGVVISNWPSGKDGLSDDDEPFWAAAAETGMPVCIHINLNSRRQRQSIRAAARKAAEAGGGGFYGGKAGKANAKAVAGLGGVFSAVPGTIGQLIFTGVFERDPGRRAPQDRGRQCRAHLRPQRRLTRITCANRPPGEPGGRYRSR